MKLNTLLVAVQDIKDTIQCSIDPLCLQKAAQAIAAMEGQLLTPLVLMRQGYNADLDPVYKLVIGEFELAASRLAKSQYGIETIQAVVLDTEQEVMAVKNYLQAFRN